MRKVTFTARFEKDVERARKRNYALSKLSAVIRLLGEGNLKDPQCQDHPLKGKYEGLRECHLAPDWLLIYKSFPDEVVLFRTGTHSDLFR